MIGCEDATSDRDITPDDPLQAIRDAVAKAAATASPAQVISAASALGLRVEQQTTYVLKGA